MANKVIIDVEARLIDRVSGQTSPIKKSIDGITDSAKKAKDELDKLGKTKVEPQVDVNENRIRKITEKIRRWLDKIDKSKATAVLDAHDKATSKIGKLAAKAKKFATQKFRTVLDAVDKASDVIGKVTSKAKDYTRRAFRAVFGADTREAVERISALGGMIKNVTGRAWHITMALKDQVTAPLRRILGMVNSVAGLAGAGLSAYGLVINPVQKQVAYENLETQFKVLLGSQEAAVARINELTSFASQTPFTRDEIYQASKVLETYTQGKLSRPDAVGGLRQIGDIAAGTGSDYTSVANTMGQMYVNMAAGNGIGDSLMSLRMMGALSADAQARIESLAAAVEEGSMDIDEAWRKVSKEFGRFDGMMLEMSNKLGNLLLGVKSMVDNNFTKKIGQGLSESLTPFLNDFRTWRSENSDKIAAFGERVKQIAADVSGFVLGKIKDIAKSISDVVGSQEFKNASLGGKIKILWDEVIAEPFSEWWSGKGRTWLSDKAQDIGKMLGDGITAFFQILGGDGAGIAGGAASVGARFAKGFLEGFDLGSVAKNIVKAIVDAFQESPLAGLLMTGFIANKLNLDGLISGAQNVFSFFTEGLGKKILGSAPGNKVAEDGTIIASSGSGLLKFGNWLGTKLGASGKGVGIKGLSAAAGGVIGGITLASGGYDIYSAATADNEYDRVHKSNTAGSKIAGVGAGAAAGAAIGSIIPGLGTAIGALIGAGIGGIGGWLGGDWLGKNAAKNAMSLKDAAKVSETAAEEFQKLKEEQLELGEVDLAKHFGKIKLSTQEMNAMINRAFDPKTTAQINKVVQAINDADASLDDMHTAGRALEKNVWLARMKNGAKLAADEIENLKQSTQEYADAAEKYLKDSQYAARSAVQDIMGDSKYTDSLLKSTDDYFGGLEKELASQKTKLNEVVNEALSDGVITIDEEKSIANVMNAIDKIQLKINEHKYNAELEMLEARYGGAGMTPDSFKTLMEGTKAAADERVNGRWSEYGAAAEGKTEEEKKILGEKLVGHIATERLTQYDMGIGQIRERYEQELGILGQDVSTLLKENSIDKIVEAAAGMDGDTRAAMAQFADILAPTKSDLEEVKARYQSLGLEVPAAVQDALNQIELMELLRDWEETNDPEAELQKWLEGKKFNLKFNPDIEVDSEAKDLGAIISNKLGTDVSFEVDSTGLINIKTEKKLSESEQDILDWYERQFNSKFEVDAQGNIKVKTQLDVVSSGGVMAWDADYHWKQLIGEDLTFHQGADGRITVSTTAELSESNEQILNQIQARLDEGSYDTVAHGNIAFDFNTSKLDVDMPTEKDIPESNLEKEGNVSWQFFKEIGRVSYPTASDIPDASPITKTVRVIWKTVKSIFTGGDDGNGFRGGMVTPNGMLQGFSQGGYVHGGAQRIVVAEEGDPEVIIPLSPRRRDRAEKLWRETGKLIHADFGEKRYATGGFVGANEGGSGYTVNRESANAAGGVSGGQVITVNVGGIDINVHVKDGQNVLEAIREQKEAIAEEVASVINEKLAEQFQNMTEKKGA